MAMTGAGMSAAIKAAVLAEGDITITDAKFIDAWAQAVVTYIQANAKVSGGTTGSPSAQTIVTAGTAIL